VPGLRALLGLLIAALALHAAVLAWLAAQWREPDVLRPMATPLFTRQIVAAAPPAAPPATTARRSAQRFKPKRPQVHVGYEDIAINNIATAVPTEPAATTTIATAEPEAVSSAPAQPATETPPPESGPAAAPASEATLSDTWPADTLLSYRLSGHYRGDLHGKAQVQWQRDGARYQVRVDLDIGWLVTLAMTSQGHVTPAGLYPTAYVETLRNRRRAALLGDDHIALNDGARLPRPDGVQDTASQFVELAWRFQTGQASLEVGRSVTFWMARPGGVDRWTYHIVGEETLVLPRLGPVQAFHLKPAPIAKPRGNINAEMWFAPALQHLPVRIRITLGNDRLSEPFVDLLVDQIEQR
jgi:Protein of unknown function (DUF3108)